MARMVGNNETAFDSTRSQFWVVDANVSGRPNCSNLNMQILTLLLIGPAATYYWGQLSGLPWMGSEPNLFLFGI